MVEAAHYIVDFRCHSYDSFISISNINLKLIKLELPYAYVAEIFPPKFLKTVLIVLTIQLKPLYITERFIIQLKT